MKNIRTGMAALATLLALSSPSYASAVYDFTGNAFEYGIIGGAYAPLQDPAQFGTQLSGAFTFDSTVTSGFTGSVGIGDVLTWSLTSGPVSASSAVAGSLTGGIFDFTNGQITGWSVSANATTPNYVLVTGLQDGGASGASAGAYNDYVVVYGLSNSPVGNGENQFYGTGPGTWTQVAATPLPASAYLFGTAFLALCGVGFSRRQKA